MRASHRLTVRGALMALSLSLASCQSEQRAAQPARQNGAGSARPAVNRPRAAPRESSDDTRGDRPAPIPASQPDIDRPAVQPDADRPQTVLHTPEAGKPGGAELPFVEVLERVDSRGPVRLDGQATDERTLSLRTENARRILITRDVTHLALRGSIAIHIDGQGIEWTQRWRSLELTRSSDGAWSATGGDRAAP